MKRPELTVSTVVLECRDAHELADFYKRFLNWPVEREEPDWVKIIHPDGVIGLSFNSDPAFERPTWPREEGKQQMMLHLDIRVDDLAAATDFALAQGAELAQFQPQDDVRVFFDPAGHPFCLWVPSS
jgi:catechol 2,3-dioxygenase-like lactoylglutathione lyase family enzyme